MSLPAHLARCPSPTPRLSYGAHERMKEIAEALGVEPWQALDLAARAATVESAKAQRAQDLEDVRRWQARAG